MKTKIVVAVLVIVYFGFLKNDIFAQEVKGVVYGLENLNGQKKDVPLFNANIYWLNSTMGTVSDVNGEFELQKPEDAHLLVVSYIGYSSDTIHVYDDALYLTVRLKQSVLLGEVTVKHRLKGEYISKIDPLKTEVITSVGLTKLACCNLSESFENNATVDVGYADAVSGAKQIQMLGLAGVYSQILTENIPNLRGLASTYGLSYIPGTWMESIQISKGTASVINGYESITGQINVEFKKPERSDRLFINAYANEHGKLEGNLLTAHKLSEKWSTMLLSSGSIQKWQIDNNEDGFLDHPLSEYINLFNRWKYVSDGGTHKAQFGVSVLLEDRDGGQLNYYSGLPNSYGLSISTKRYRVYAKTGFVVSDKNASNIGIMFDATLHDQSSFFGNSNYHGEEQSYYGNVIYQGQIKSDRHKYSTGASYKYIDLKENLNDSLMIIKESVPGIFAQYTFEKVDKMTFILGGRADHNSEYGVLLTPRMHAKYNITDKFIFRGSAGKGYRTANVLAENVGLLASARKLTFEEFDIEQAWNYGINFTKEFQISEESKITWTTDLYRTDFVNQVVVDMDNSSNKVLFYNLKGKSYSNSFQTSLTIVPIKGLDITAAYRFNDVKVSISDELIDKPFVKRSKSLVTCSYATNMDKWQFDFTLLHHGKSRLPSTLDNPIQYQMSESSPDYFVMHAQITKRFRWIDIYIGGENLTNFVQENPILASDEPFGEYFDTSFIWGPIMGRMIYFGLRYELI